MNKEELWQAVLANVQINVSPANFATWLKDTKIVWAENSQVKISVPNNFSKEWLKNKYHKLILKTLCDLEPKIKDVEYEVTKTNLKNADKRLSSPPLSLPAENDQLEFHSFQIDKTSNLNPRYTFDNFIIGSFNELPHAAAQAVVKTPAIAYNPLFIYGGVGLGKTHLLQAIGNGIVKIHPSKRIKYLTSEKFTSEIISSIRNQSIDRLKSAYKETDVLIIDDIQFIAGKEKTQEEFFNIFNALYEKNKQIVISSDRPPNAIQALEERLCSRFEGGMIADIIPPDFETRIAILKAKVQEKKADIDSQVLSYIGQNIKKNIME